jgi:hypothetical protein
LSTAVAAAIMASFAFKAPALARATPSSSQAAASNVSAMSPFFASEASEASGWAMRLAQASRVVDGMPRSRAVRPTLPPLAASAARADARKSSLYRRH